MITSPDNEQLKTIRKLQAKKHRERTGLFVAEGEDLVEAATWEPEILLVADVDVEPALLVCLGAERDGLPADFACDLRAGIPLRDDGPDSLNVAMAATVALYELGNRITADA